MEQVYENWLKINSQIYQIGAIERTVIDEPSTFTNSKVKLSKIVNLFQGEKIFPTTIIVNT